MVIRLSRFNSIFDFFFYLCEAGYLEVSMEKKKTTNGQNKWSGQVCFDYEILNNMLCSAGSTINK